MTAGPLAGVKVLELVGLGPGPFAGMLLSDMGADVLCVDRPVSVSSAGGALVRGKRTVAVDVKAPGGVDAVLALADRADVLIDVFRPGVAERLGFGPDVCLARNQRLVYVRLTGFGQDGPWASKAGHDLDFLALAGALEPLGRAGGPPTAPINVLGDFAGGGLLAAYGAVMALFERERSGRGQVVDAAMIDGAALLLAPFYAARSMGGWGPRGTNVLDGGAPWYDTYECSDGRWLTLGAIEPQFYADLLKGLGFADDPADQYDQAGWPSLRERIAATVGSKTRDEWVAVFDPLEACVAPALAPEEAPSHPHHVARGMFVTDDAGRPEPAPAPRFSRTPGAVQHPDPDGRQALADWDLPAEHLAAFGF
jgi:alpha-methylacyl-CoA racemase